MSGFADISIAALSGLVVAVLAGFAVRGTESALVRSLRRVQPGLRACTLLALLVAPLMLGIFAAALIAVSTHGTAIDLVPHHCHVTGPDCVAHDPAAPTVALIALGGGLMAAVAVWTGFSLLDHGLRTGDALRMLTAASDRQEQSSVRILRTDAIVALASGILRPRLFLSRGLCDRLEREETDIVLRHEQAHVRRFDNLARLFGAAFAVGHWPRTAAILREELALAQEQACDRVTARRHGALRAAETLVKVERMRGNAAFGTCCGAAYADVPIAARVQALVAPDFVSTGRSSAVILSAALACLGSIALGAEPLHHEIETVVTLLQD
ncbi:MAG: M56 family metallopeptidase [Alphaproteobacteria bacterium]